MLTGLGTSENDRARAALRAALLYCAEKRRKRCKRRKAPKTMQSPKTPKSAEKRRSIDEIWYMGNPYFTPTLN